MPTAIATFAASFTTDAVIGAGLAAGTAYYAAAAAYLFAYTASSSLIPQSMEILQ